MIVRPPEPAAVELLAYPLRPTPCPLCSVPRLRGPGSVSAIGRCPRCNGARTVYRPPAPALVSIDHDHPEALA